MPPTGAPPERIAAQRWAILLVEPLCSLEQRQNVEGAFFATVVTKPEWWTVYISGVLADIVGTLPDDDPFRFITLRPDGSADWTDDRPQFGTWESATDVIEPSSDAPTLDPSFLAIEDPLPPLASGLICRAFAGWGAVVDPLSETLQHHGNRKTFDVATAAIRFAQHRRRSYGLPADDVWPVISGFMWAWRAHWVVDGRLLDEAQIASAIVTEKIQVRDPDT
ncbi:MAG: hypothetical protein ACYDEP_02545 [Acidimicrobiales bacterium]